MSGLDKIVEEIHRQAEAEAVQILNKADEYCKTYMEEVHKKVQEEVDEYNKKALAERTLYEEKIRSGGAFMERNNILKVKQQCISEVINEAQNKIRNLPANEYFSFFEKILKTNVQPGNGIMKMSADDLKRMPDNFEENIKQIAETCGGTLTVSRQPIPVKDGFILVYGEVEENCTLKALFDTNIDKLKDIANEALFG